MRSPRSRQAAGVGYTIPPNADAGWIGEAGPGPSYLDPGSGGPASSSQTLTNHGKGLTYVSLGDIDV